jgi:putative hydrolase of the HAD superfamily
MARIKGILFDLGETLLDFGVLDVGRLFREGARLAYAFLKRHGQPVPAFASFHRRQFWAIRWRYMLSRLWGREFNALDLLGRLSREMGQSLTPEQTEELAWLWYQPLARCARIEPGLHELLGRLRREGLRLGVVSNTFVPGVVLDRHLAELALLEHLAVRVYSCEVRYRKPRPEIFRIALARLGVAAGEVLFVGDRPRADVSGARRVGMIPVLKDPAAGRRSRRRAPARRIASLSELPAVVAEYNAPGPGAD